VGSPLSSSPLQTSVHQCDIDVETSETSCSGMRLMESEDVILPRQGEWMGGSITATNHSLYICAFRQGADTYSESPTSMGACYQAINQSIVQLIDFKKIHWEEGRPETYGHWTWRQQNGIYGFSSTVSLDGRLVAGNPTKVNRNYGSMLQYNCGTIGEVEHGKYRCPGYIDGRTSFFKVDNAYIRENGVDAYMNLGKLAGYSVSRGMFLGKEKPLSYILGAPRADLSKGAVYLCTDCFGQDISNTFFAELKVDYKSFTDHDHLHMGEEFGMAVAACDVSGDGKDDLLVGSPGYSESGEHYNTGRVHVFLSTGDSRQWSDISDPKTLEPKVVRDAARFGSAIMFGLHRQ